MICAKHLFVFPSIAQECGLSHSLPELFPSSHCVVERFVLHRAGKVCVWGGALVRLFTNELCRQLQERQILLLSSPTP